MRVILVTLGMTATLFAGVLGGQAKPAPAPPAKPATAPVPAPQAPPAPPPVDAYSYDPQGRRDPFVSALGTGAEAKLTGKKGMGPAGMLTAEISVRGILQNGAVFTAIVQGPDTKTYIMHAGDKLLDGTVKTITPEGLTVVQDVNDPLSLEKTREVRRPLRSREDGKP